MLAFPTPDPTPEELADWAELCCLFGHRRTLGAALLGDVLQEELSIEDFEAFALGTGLAAEKVDAAEEAEERIRMHDAVAEGLDPATEYVETVLSRLTFRSQVIGDRYQLQIGRSSISRAAEWQERPIYPFLTLLSARMLYKLPWPFHRPARLFEKVVAVAAANLVNGLGERFGWPPHDGDHGGAAFLARVQALARRMNEELGRMRNIGPSAKDYALDVIAWRGFDDARAPGQIVLLCQCAIGEDWNQKVLSIGSWREVVNFNLLPTSALAFPGVPSRAPEDIHVWHDITSKDALPLDRLRIASLVEEADCDTELLDDLREWMAEVVPTLPFLDGA